MHQSRIHDTIVINIYEYVDVYDNLIYVTEAKGLGIILVILQTVCYTGAGSHEHDPKSGGVSILA